MNRNDLNALIKETNTEHLVSEEMIRNYLTPELDADFEVLDKLIGLNDTAHQWNHIIDVTLGAMRIVEESLESYVYDCKVVVCAALWHDSASGLDRDLHHVKGGLLYHLFSTNRPSQERVDWIGECIFTHRKSCGAEPATKEAMAVAVADKGKPVQCYSEMLNRGVTFNAEKRAGIGADPKVCDLIAAIAHRWDILKKVQGESEVWKAWRQQAGYDNFLELHKGLPTLEDLEWFGESDNNTPLRDFRNRCSANTVGGVLRFMRKTL